MSTQLDNTTLHCRGGLAVVAVLAVSLAACQPMPRTAAGPAPTFGREIVITAQDIQQMGAQTAWDAVRIRVPSLRYGSDVNGQPATVRIQEQRSVNADETPLLVVDGSRVGDIGYLSGIPAADVARIRILRGEDATPLFGIAAAGGAIVVETKRR